jgi:hypothetical protein
MANIRTLKDIKESGLTMVAVCHNVSCRHTKNVDLHALIKAIGEMASLLPVKDQPHFSERMRCPECKHRGMFLWVEAPKTPSPISNSALNFRVIAYDRMTAAAQTDVLRAADREVAQAGFEVAEAIYPKHRLEMTWHNRVIHQSHMKLVKGGRG